MNAKPPDKPKDLTGSSTDSTLIECVLCSAALNDKSLWFVEILPGFPIGDSGYLLCENCYATLNAEIEV